MSDNSATEGNLWDSYYKKKCTINSVNTKIELRIEDFYVNLEGIDFGEIGNVKNYRKATTDANFNRRDGQFIGRRINQETGDTIKPKDIFSCNKKRTLMYGSPGTGKSTLCKRIVYDFYVNEIGKHNFTDIIWIPLRNFKQPHCMKYLQESKEHLNRISWNVIRILFETSGKDEEFWKSLMCDRKKNILYILDGWDEIHHLMQDEEYSRFKNVVNMFYEKENVILTTRPFAYGNVKQFNQVFEVTGFNMDNIRRYTRKILTETNSLDQFSNLAIYTSTTLVNDLTSIPILLDIFLFCWKSIEHFKEPLTMTRLYGILFTKLWESFQERAGNEFTKDLSNALYHSLCRLRRKWVDDGKLDFCTKDFGLKNNLRDSINKAPFVNKCSGDDGIKEWYTFEFVHLTICEYFAALDIVSRAEEDSGFLKDFVASHKYNPRLSLVLQFTAGLLDSKNKMEKMERSKIKMEKMERSKNSNLTFFFDCLEADPFDLLGYYHYPLLCNCLSECSNLESKRSNEIYEEIFEFICGYPDNINKFPKLPLQLVERILKEKLEISLNFRLPCLPPKLIEYIKAQKAPPLLKFSLLCKQLSHCKESENYVYALCKALEKTSYESEMYLHVLLLQPKMKIHIIANTINGRDLKIKMCHSLRHDFVNEKDLLKVCRSFEPKIKSSSSLLEKLVKSSSGNRYFIKCLRFLKNTPGMFDKLCEYMNKTLKEYRKTNKGFQFYKNLFEWISTFKIDRDEIRRKLIFLAKQNVQLDVKQEAVLSLLNLYHGKDIPERESQCICTYIQNPPEPSCKLNPILHELSLCGFLAKQEEEILKNWCISNSHLLEQEKVDRHSLKRILIMCFNRRGNNSSIRSLFRKRCFNENQIRALINNNNCSLEGKIDVLLNHLKLEPVRELVSNLKSESDIETVKFALSLTPTSEMVDYPEYFKTRYNLETLPDMETILKNYKTSLENGTLQNLSQSDIENDNPGIDGEQRLSLKTFELKFPKQQTLEIFGLSSADSQRMIASNTELLCKNILDEQLGDHIYSALRANIAGSPELFIKHMTPQNFQKLFHLICGVQLYSQDWLAIYIVNGLFYYGTFHSNTQHKIPSEYTENCITTLGVDRCCRNVRLNVDKDFKKFTFKADLKYLDKLKTNVKFIEKIIQKLSLGNGGNKYQRERTITCQDVMDDETLFDHQTKLEFIKALFNQKFTEDTPLKTILLSFQHLDFSESNITDNCVFVNILSDKFLDFILGSHVHTLILSGNKLTSKGLLNLLKDISRIQNSKLKHLFLDGNYISFTEENDFIYFIETLSKEINTLELLDISGNFISHSWIENLINDCSYKVFEIPESNFAYFLVNNGKLIFSRKFLEKSLVPVVDVIKGKNEILIDEEYGCVGIAHQENNKLGYSGHHLLIIEKIENGQRLLLTAELFVESLDKCTIKINEVDPLNDLKKRMEKYAIERGTFKNSEISKLIDAIKASKRQQDFFHYDLDMQGENLNCIKWVSGIMKTVTEYKVTQVNAPPSILIKIYNNIKQIQRDKRLPPNSVLFCIPVLIAVLIYLVITFVH